MAKKGSARKGEGPASRRGKNGIRSEERTEDSGTAKRAEQARQLVLAEWSRIVEGLIGKAVEGGYQQAKLLFELCDWSEDEDAKLSQRNRAQLCDLLLEQMDLEPPDSEKKG